MGAVDPTYPLFPIASIIAAASLLLILLTGFVRHSWNLGLFFLCFWLFFMNVTNGVNAIIWADNADIKLYVYCDIVSHLQIIVLVAKASTTLVIVRRLYLIVSNQSVELPSKAAVRWNVVLEWTLGVIIPIIVAGPLYYIVQPIRFIVVEGFGCRDVLLDSVLMFLLIPSWAIIFPLLSILIYYPKVAYTFYRHNKDVNRFLRSNGSVSRAIYFRVFALASIDIIITLPFSITDFILNIFSALPAPPFYGPFGRIHSDWGPESTTYAEWTWSPHATASLYFSLWISPVLAFVIFGLFGLSGEALASYWNVFNIVRGWLDWKSPMRMRGSVASALGTMQFGTRPEDTANSVTVGTVGIIPVSSVTDTSQQSSEERTNEKIKEKHDDVPQVTDETGDSERTDLHHPHAV